MPNSFPGNVELVTNDKRGVSLLKEDYRKTNTPEFEYFITTLLPKIAHHRIRFDKKKRKQMISRIFTIQDEAFGLLILCNEYDVWVWQRKEREKGKKGNQLRIKKKFVDWNSGKNNSWSEQGISVFNCLCLEIQVRRDTEESKKMEKDLMDKLNKRQSSIPELNAAEPTWFDKKFGNGIAPPVFPINWSECI